MAGGYEWVVILVVALLLFGGSRLAGVGKGIGRSIREFRQEVKDPTEGQNPRQIDSDSSESGGSDTSSDDDR